MPEDTPEYLKRSECADCLSHQLESLLNGERKAINSALAEKDKMIAFLTEQIKLLRERHIRLINSTAGGRNHD